MATGAKPCMKRLRYGPVRRLSADGERSSRIIEPHYLVSRHPVWYVLSWDHLRNSIRSFRLDRIAEAKSLPERFEIRFDPPFTRHVDLLHERI